MSTSSARARTRWAGFPWAASLPRQPPPQTAKNKPAHERRFASSVHRQGRLRGGSVDPPHLFCETLPVVHVAPGRPAKPLDRRLVEHPDGLGRRTDDQGIVRKLLA